MTSDLQRINDQMAEPDFWANQSSAQQVIARKQILERELTRWTTLDKRDQDLQTLLELVEAEEAEDELGEVTQELVSLEDELARIRTQMLLSEDKDINSAIVAFHPGAGGTESQDWAEMLMRMYVRWAERRGFRVNTVDLIQGDEAGIKSATLSISGDYAYGYLKGEAGVHRLVRISPYDSNKRRHTSFASVFVYPEIEEGVDVTIDDKDLRIDTFRASGAGGQHINKTSSAIRITHIPTNIVVQCQNERSQHKNKSAAMKVLHARLYAREQEKQDQEMQACGGEKKDIAWGHQLRSYVYQPYQLVKDHRTNHEVGNIEAVLNGNLDPFIEAYLAKRAAQGSASSPASRVGRLDTPT
jgi:peptide chain release factor 2